MGLKGVGVRGDPDYPYKWEWMPYKKMPAIRLRQNYPVEGPPGGGRKGCLDGLAKSDRGESCLSPRRTLAKRCVMGMEEDNFQDSTSGRVSRCRGFS